MAKKSAQRVALERAVDALGGKRFNFWNGETPSAEAMLKALRVVMETPHGRNLNNPNYARYIVMSAYYWLAFAPEDMPLEDMNPQSVGGGSLAEIVRFGQIIRDMDGEVFT